MAVFFNHDATIFKQPTSERCNNYLNGIEMKKILFGILVGFLFVTTGCKDEDGYSLNNAWVGFGIFQAVDNDSYQIVMDNKDVLVPVASNYPHGWQETIKNGERIVVNYTILDEDINSSLPRYFVRVNYLKDVLMKGVMDITPENADSIGNDPIIVEDYWMTDSLLNFKLYYWGHSEIHFLNLVKEPGVISPESQPIELELRHNANDDNESYRYSAYVSFSLNSLRIAGQDTVKFVVTATDYDGMEFSEECVFDYSGLPE